VDELLRAGEAGVGLSGCMLPEGEAPPRYEEGDIPPGKAGGEIPPRYAEGVFPPMKAAAASDPEGDPPSPELSGWLEGEGQT
jgi:hypothetical protein